MSNNANKNLLELNQNLTHYILVEDRSLGINLFLENLAEYLYDYQRTDESTKMRVNQISPGTPHLPSIAQNITPTLNIGQPNTNEAKEAKKMADRKRAESLFDYLQKNELPIVAILIKGGYGVSKLVKKQIEKRIPVVVLRGSGGLADLLAFVDVEIRSRRTDLWNVEFVESYLKPELSIKIMESFPDLRNNSLVLNQFRQRILDISRLSKDIKSGQNYLTVINMLDIHSVDLENLTEQLLLALFRSQRAEMADETDAETQHESDSNLMILRDLSLCIDWNCPEMAKKEVLAKHPKFQLSSNATILLFENSLIRENRWKIVDLFLSQKYKLRRYVSKRLKKIFRLILANKFFVNYCWEGILRRNKSTITWFLKQDDLDEQRRHDFLEKHPSLTPRISSWCRDFNWLVEACTGISDFLDETELDNFRIDIYESECLTEKEAERKCLELLVFWAIFDYRRHLVHILWKHSDQPIHLAIVIALAYQHLSWYITEETLSNRLKEESNLFVSFACDLLDIVHKDNPYRAQELLNESLKRFKFKTSVDLAAVGRFRVFFSHESVQRWLTRQTYGNIDIKEMRFGIFRLPPMMQLILSTYLVFPAYFWIRIINAEEEHKSQELLQLDVPSEEDLIDMADMKKESVTDISKISKSGKSAESLTKKPAMRTDDTRKRLTEPIKRVAKTYTLINDDQSPIKGESRPPLFTMVYELWTAPITKFWNFQFFYTFYLSLFSIAVLYPACGHKLIDKIIFVWTLFLIMDSIRQTYLIYQRQTKIQVFKIFLICFQIVFLSYFGYYRLLTDPKTVNEAYFIKVLMCLALLHAYLVLLIVFLPISPTLGPLLYRLRIMIYVDFINFIRLSILVMISFGIILQALFYPDQTIDGSLALQAFHRAFFSMYRAFTDDLESNGHSLK